MNQYKYHIEYENFNDGKGRIESSLQEAIDNLGHEGLIYARTEYSTFDGRIMICIVNADRNEISGKNIEEVEEILHKKVDARRFPENRPLAKLVNQP